MHLTAQLVHIIEDLPGALDRLTGVAGTARFEHVVAQLRSEHISWQGLQAAESQWREKGFTALDERPRWDETRVDLCYLRTADGAEIDEAAVADSRTVGRAHRRGNRRDRCRDWRGRR
jgi:ParB family transcriptional regulator, chromosome partitioning protein